jgi:alcohol dehydrogenase (cytochrome c)
LLDYQRNGKTIQGLVDVARDGYLWFLDRGSLASSRPHIGFVAAKPYIYQNVFKSIDPVTGRPDVDLEHKPGTGKRADFCPGSHGGKTWPPIAFSPKTRMIYIPANNNMCGSSMGVKAPYTAGKPFVGVGGSRPFTVPGADHFGEVQAWNVDTGEKVWTHEYAKSPNWGSMLATAGGLVFSGGTNDRKFHAFDAMTGRLLWEFPTNSGIEAPPTSFLIDGKQYIAIESGWGGDARGDQNNLNRLFPGEFPEVPEGGAVWVFAVQ